MATAVPTDTGHERAVTYLASELNQRLRTWAALLGLPTSHLLARVITEATPSRDQLAEMVHRAGQSGPLTAQKGTTTDGH